jgi:hypothetical protein
MCFLANTLAYYDPSTITAVISFIVLASEVVIHMPRPTMIKNLPHCLEILNTFKIKIVSVSSGPRYQQGVTVSAPHELQ